MVTVEYSENGGVNDCKEYFADYDVIFHLFSVYGGSSNFVIRPFFVDRFYLTSRVTSQILSHIKQSETFIINLYFTRFVN